MVAEVRLPGLPQDLVGQVAAGPHQGGDGHPEVELLEEDPAPVAQSLAAGGQQGIGLKGEGAGLRGGRQGT